MIWMNSVEKRQCRIICNKKYTICARERNAMDVEHIVLENVFYGLTSIMVVLWLFSAQENKQQKSDKY